MRYSPLVERYLITHNYETINNVKKWKMLLTQRTEIQRDVDRKFKKFKQIADQANFLMNSWNAEYKQFCKESDEKLHINKVSANAHNDNLTNLANDKKENGSYPEFANIITSIHQQKYQKQDEDD